MGVFSLATKILQTVLSNYLIMFYVSSCLVMFYVSVKVTCDKYLRLPKGYFGVEDDLAGREAEVFEPKPPKGQLS